MNKIDELGELLKTQIEQVNGIADALENYLFALEDIRDELQDEQEQN